MTSGLTPKNLLRLVCTFGKFGLITGLLTGLLIALPLIGTYLAGSPLDFYLKFPPTSYIQQPDFSWPVFLAILLAIVVAVSPFLVRIIRVRTEGSGDSPTNRPLSWWGWLGGSLIAIGWVVAWSHYPPLESWQRYAFLSLWLGYILLINGLIHRRTGGCPLLSQPGRFLLLFPLSALFWWFFEYLNLFANNWYYLGLKQVTPLEFALSATLSFSTVLPAVISTTHWLAGFRRLDRAFVHCWPVRPIYPRALALLAVLATLVSLVGLGGWPRFFFPLIWVSPLVIIIGSQVLLGQKTILTPLMRGDWRPFCLPALAGLFCGLWWELWNYHSLTHWQYSIPYVSRFYLFEMPVLGYSGYLPFGIQCLLAASLLGGNPLAGSTEAQ